MRKVTIEDISRETGLSRGTVSRALNNRADISLDTRQRVLDACKKLKYVPSHAARSLATGRNFTLAVFVDDLQSPLAAAMIRGALGIAGPQGYFVHLIELNPRVPAADRIRQLAAERIDGALLFAPLDAEAAALLRAALEDRPIAGSVLIADLPADVFEPDQAEAGRAAARYLVEQSADCPAYLHRGARGWNERIRGFREAWTAAGRDEAAIRACDLGAATTALDANHIDAIVLDQSDLLAGAMRAAPQLASADVAIVGLGETGSGAPRAEQTTIQFGGEEIGRRAAHAVLQRIEQGREDPPQFVRVAPRLTQPEPESMPSGAG
jgi:DNA-binding LacI/PurR family transcriptional regulator